MSEELDYKTFDLAAVLAGRDYPETEVKVYFDEKLGFTINKLREAINEADRRGDDEVAANLQGELDGLIAKVKDAEFSVLVRGIPEGQKHAILTSLRAEFPPETDMFGQEKENLEADRAFVRRLWASTIVKITDPTGAVQLMDEKLAALLQDQAPKAAQKVINQAVNEVSEGASLGFEYAAREVDFLSIASPEG